MSPAFSLCVYCAASHSTDPVYAAAAREIGHWIGARGGQLVYGGGHHGLMGVVADAALESGAPVVGIIPKAMVEREWAYEGCTELHIVDTMHERKRMMAERSDAFVALPGGVGTLEELFEAWAWRQLGYHDKPIGLLNVAGYYDGMLRFLEHGVSTGLLSPDVMPLVRWDDQAARLLPALLEEARLTRSHGRLAEL